MSRTQKKVSAIELSEKNDTNSTSSHTLSSATSLPADKSPTIREFDQEHKHFAAGFFNHSITKNPQKPVSTAEQVWDILSHPTRINLP